MKEIHLSPRIHNWFEDTKEDPKELKNLSFSQLGFEKGNGVTNKELTQIVRFCPKLTSVDLDSSSNVGSAGISRLCKLENLKELRFSHCKHAGGYWTLRKLKNATELESISVPRLTDLNCSTLSSNRQLQKITAGKIHYVTSRGWKKLGRLPNFTNLEVEDSSHIDDENLKDLIYLKNLKSLKLAHCDFSGYRSGSAFARMLHLCANTPGRPWMHKGWRFLEKCKSLQALDLYGSEIRALDLSYIAKIPQITDLGLDLCNVDDKGLVEIAKMQQLKKLHLRQSLHISDNGLTALHSLKNLEMIDIRGCRISQQGLKHLEKLPKLK